MGFKLSRNNFNKFNGSVNAPSVKKVPYCLMMEEVFGILNPAAQSRIGLVWE